MCGIVGIFSFSDKALTLSDLRPLNEAMVHRGPDEDGYFIEGPLGLAMRRLSIIDLGSGQQPMTSPDGNYVIVYNGECYNYQEVQSELQRLGHRFRTNSDTEVIVT